MHRPKEMSLKICKFTYLFFTFFSRSLKLKSLRKQKLLFTFSVIITMLSFTVTKFSLFNPLEHILSLSF